MSDQNLLVYKEGIPPTALKEWRWETQDGAHIKPSIMRTGHLFNTIVMLWHHFMPADAHLFRHRRYRMGDRFTPEYTELALRILLIELCSREDMTAFHRKSLERMSAYFRKKVTPERDQARLSMSEGEG